MAKRIRVDGRLYEAVDGDLRGRVADYLRKLSDDSVVALWNVGRDPDEPDYVYDMDDLGDLAWRVGASRLVRDAVESRDEGDFDPDDRYVFYDADDRLASFTDWTRDYAPIDGMFADRIVRDMDDLGDPGLRRILSEG